MANSPPPDNDDEFAATEVGDVPIAMVTMDAAVDYIIRPRGSGVEGRGRAVRLIGAKEVALASRSAEYRELLSGSGVNFADGFPVVWALRRFASGDADVERIRGATLFRACLDQGRSSEIRHFFLGTTPATLELLVAAAQRNFPGAVIAGTWAPPFGPLSDDFYETSARKVTAAAADVVWVGIGAPKQNFAVTRLAERNPCAFVAVGAAFDFLAGTAREAPVFVQNSGFEWAFRFASNPRRFWRRYLIGNSQFVAAVARQILRRRRGTSSAPHESDLARND